MDPDPACASMLCTSRCQATIPRAKLPARWPAGSRLNPVEARVAQMESAEREVETAREICRRMSRMFCGPGYAAGYVVQQGAALCSQVKDLDATWDSDPTSRTPSRGVLSVQPDAGAGSLPGRRI